MKKFTFYVSKMDCQCEEQVIRLALQDFTEILHIDFDLNQRILTVYSDALDYKCYLNKINALDLDGNFISMENTVLPNEKQKSQSNALWISLLLNLALFLIEALFGLFSYSIGLIADSLDMLADAIVYGMALFAVYKSVAIRKRVAKWSGYLQILLAFIGLYEIIKRFMYFEGIPNFQIMIFISILALIVNITSLFLLKKQQSQDAHIQASVIFTSNDILINLGVIFSALLVMYFNSSYPDLIIGTIIFFFVLNGARKILRLAY